MKTLSLAALAAVVAFTGCTRSPAFRQDQEYTKSEPASYYSSAATTPTQRIESMGQPKKRVLVLNFWNNTPVRESEMGLFAAEELRRGLISTQRLLLTTEKSSLSTEDLIQGEKIKVAQLIREGRRLGVSVLIIGRVTKAIFRQRGDDVGLLRQKQSLAGADVEIKVFDVSMGREILALSRSGEASANSLVAFEGKSLQSKEYRSELTHLAIRNAVAPLIPEVVRGIEKMTWEGRIAKVAGTKVYVNAGKNSGLMGGDILRVLTPGDDIYDPVTGAFLGRSPGQLKGTLELVEFIGPDGALTEVHTGANFQEGDVVQLY
ncbi:MAG: hypothetical protein A2070_06890 [Bdellovibrionales bacterium GWC1_52_8]|nr:MAG: hypothetical protein A2Z97_07925 [Bdellovibrionales bacterium GWB1_52_6]OFZ03113.1 MAG: hypothetical protein A2X97_09760 [Bdellovibrionales bacterium GWA1_52_35]OFZ36840.1 MAG: hypothetical protein A2070_06890 [Bdellovibrionales bacterium GWC1_52_8]HCM40440.1 hypothetical protein [Bdellovibrionales bacterium]